MGRRRTVASMSGGQRRARATIWLVAILIAVGGCRQQPSPGAAASTEASAAIARSTPPDTTTVADGPSITETLVAPPRTDPIGDSPGGLVVAATAPSYVFPIVGAKASYARTHHDYPASDVFACGATFVAPTNGTVDEVSEVDRWDAEVNDPATRGGLIVSMVGDDGVRYYGAHLDEVLVVPGQVVAMADPLGIVGQTGNARNSACHLHFGISRPCTGGEWAVRRGEVWPWPYLDAWRDGQQTSPALEVFKAEQEVPDACNFAEATAGGD
jgi:peptidoglycan LD-endopeptidase LytH